MKLRIGEKGDLIRNIQKKLMELGYNPGPIDGIFDERTKKAIMRLQKNRNFEDDGILGPNTLKALGLNGELHTPRPARKVRRGILTPGQGKRAMHRR